MVALGAVYTYRQPKVYESTCSIIIDPSAPQVLQGIKDVVELGTGTYWANREFYETQYRLIQSRDIAEQVVANLGLQADLSFPGPKPRKAGVPVDLVPALLAQIRVLPVRESRIANIIVSDLNPERAARIANATAQAYIDHNLDYKVEGSRAATQWLGDQVVDFRNRLKRSEQMLYEFRKARSLLDVDLGDRQSMTSQNLQVYNQKLADVRAKRIEIESNRKVILAARNNIEEQESIPEIRQNVVLQQLHVTYIDLQKERAALEAQYGEKHPKLLSLRDKIETVRRDYVAELGKILKSVEKQYQVVVDNERSLMALMEREKQQAIELTKLELEYRPLQREAENNKRVYELVTQREKETGLTGLIRNNNVRILDRAGPSFGAVKPRIIVNLAVSMVLGLLIGVGIAVAMELLDVTVKNQEQVESILGVPVLGMVPVMGEKHDGRLSPDELRKRDLGVLFEPRSPAAEACRSIRTNLMFISTERRLQSIVVTSPGPQEGKTTTAISLALTMAAAGTRVLLVDTDLRRPRLHKSFNLPNDRGISNAIVGDAKLKDVIRSTEAPNLGVLTCGPIPPNPAELLHTERFKQLVREAESMFDVIIYDSSPVSAVTDPAILSNLVDGVILIVRGGRTTKEAAAFARRQLTDAKGRLLGAVVNAVDFRDRAYGYYYSRYRSYAKYGYGYGPDTSVTST